MTTAHYLDLWEKKFRTHEWGRYPPEDLVRFMGRNFSGIDRSTIRVLEVGSGAGANLWFLHREGFRVSGIDGAPTGVERARGRLEKENAGLNAHAPDLVAGNFSKLPWDDATFDVVIDIFAIYANPIAVIDQTLAEVSRVLKPGGMFFSKCWGKRSTGYGKGIEVEPDTFDAIPEGPCRQMGITHFYDIESMRRIYSKHFDVRLIDTIMRSDLARDYEAEEFSGQCVKKAL